MGLTGWSYYATETITGSTDGTLTNKRIRITIPYQSFMNADFSDIRFCASDGETLLSHNRVSYTASTSAIFDVKIPSLDASPSTYTLHIYAGNSAATDVSNPRDVYSYYEDWEDGLYTGRSSPYRNWTVQGGTASIISSGQISGNYSLKHDGASASSPTGITVPDTLSNYIAELNIKLNTLGGASNDPVTTLFFLRYVDANNFVCLDTYYYNSQYIRLLKRENGAYTTIKEVSGYSRAAVGDSHHYKIVDTGSHCIIYRDGTSIIDINYSSTVAKTQKGMGCYQTNAMICDNIIIDQQSVHEPTVGSLSSWIQTSSIPTSSLFPGLVSVIPYGGILIEDINGIILSEIDYAVQRGIPSPIQQIKLVNQSSKDKTVTLTPSSSTSQNGTSVETYQAQFLSSDGTTYTNSLTVTVPASGTKTVYTKYSPPDNTIPGPKEWKLGSSQQYSLPFNMPAGWNYVNVLPITGSTDGAYTNALVTVQIPFAGTVMNADYSDIRFYTMDGTQLSYQLVSTVGGSGTFKLLIPNLPGSPTVTKLFVIAGNENATTTSTTVTGTTPTTAPTIGSLEAWNYYGSLECKADVQYSKQEIEGLDYTPSFLVKVGGVGYE